MPEPFWADPAARGLFDRVQIAGAWVPGVAKVKPSVEQLLDVQPIAGSEGAVVKFKGRPAAKFDVALTLYTADEWALLQEQIRTLWPPLGKSIPNGVDITHPFLKFYGITKAWILSIDGPELDFAKETTALTLKCVEYKTPTKAPAPKSNADLRSRGNSLTPPPNHAPPAALARDGGSFQMFPPTPPSATPVKP